MQSGISASAELTAAFQNLLSSPSQRGLLISIESERLVPSSTLPGTSSFYADLSALSTQLKPDAARYIILRRPDSLSATSQPGELVLVTYIPLPAPVRQKTLFASTRLSLPRELGSEHFGEHVWVERADEVTEEGWRKHEKHVQLDQPLTQEERDLVGIKEAEAKESGGTGSRRGHTGGTLDIRVGDRVVDTLRDLKNGGPNLVQLKFDIPTETVVLDSTKSATPASLSNDISSTEPRYSFYRHTNDAILFIYTCPTTSKIKERMIYATSERSVRGLATSEAGIEIAKKLEASNPADVTAQSIEDEFKETIVETKQAFSKPKRPGRR
ncbi:actin monomer binding protein-like protein [Pseudovirgaria hyperparasitica]|uniref:Twinfilin n=1 Tax=Pseudovirgaria hyperparasitica TaxID=470096 RepID=A0A6A6WMM3_9PEZI|nr:actin monomer binding protein-like protein [Pseudovirgaria hyperparasitica]KAF2763477.1 actin monomer binding protein-like protein [Pseudovirgaria hyperparasitica]